MHNFLQKLEEARTRYNEILTPAKKKNTYVCPLCGNGTGTDGDGLAPVPGKYGALKCFKCSFYGDIFDLYAKEHHTSQQESFTAVLKQLGYNLEHENKKPSEGRTGAQNSTRSNTPKAEPIKSSGGSYQPDPQKEQYQRPETDGLYDPEARQYLHSRGIMIKTARDFGLFYVADWVSPKAEGKGAAITPTKRICIPTSEGGYTARAIEPVEKKYQKMKHGEAGFLNLPALDADTTEPVFIVEGEFDALSLQEIGFDAVSIGSTSNITRLADHLNADRNTMTRPVIVCLDADEAGQKAAKNLIQNLLKPVIFAICADICGEYKDPNEFLVADRQGFIDTVRAAADRAKAVKAMQDAATRKKSSIAGFMDQFRAHIEDSSRVRPIATGFAGLDKPLGGGLYPGLVFMGAISSLGKTTFLLQIAENISRSGTDVLYFSLEMSKDELIAKTISRLTYEISKFNGKGPQNAKTTLGILDGSRYQHYNREEQELIEQAMTRYEAENAPHLWFYEGVGDIGVQAIREAILQHIRQSGRRVVVMIDYLQILAPYDAKLTDKQNIDKTVLELKRISRDYSIPILAISSLNRESYTAPVNVSAFKESGAIEYGADVLIGLQFAGMDYQKGDIKEKRVMRVNALMDEAQQKQRNGIPVTCQVKVLKNRNGPKENEIYLDFVARFNDYQPAKEDLSWTEVEPETTEQGKSLCSLL